jgi:hypothetical protein
VTLPRRDERVHVAFAGAAIDEGERLRILGREPAKGGGRLGRGALLEERDVAAGFGLVHVFRAARDRGGDRGRTHEGEEVRSVRHGQSSERTSP